MSENDELRPDQWSDRINVWTGFKCRCPVEHESERRGPFRLFSQKCSYGPESFEVRDENGDLIQTFKSIEEARINISGRNAIMLENQQDNVDTKDIHTDTGEV